MKGKIYFVLSLILVGFLASPKVRAYPYSSRPANENCNTEGQYDANTRATVYGDSRMDIAGLYGVIDEQNRRNR